jgi:hypothetical protein
MNKALRIAACAMWVNVIAVGATAETTIIASPPCVVSVDVTALKGVAAADLNRHREAAASVEVYYVDVAPGWASRRLFMAMLDDNSREFDDRRVVNIGDCAR